VCAPGGFMLPEGVVLMSQPPRRRRLEVEDIGDVTVVNFVDKRILDEQNIQIIGEQLFSLVDEVGRRKLLLNFGNVEFLSSAALGKLIALHKKLQAVGGRLILCNIDPEIYEVFEITRLDKFFNIRKEEQAALQEF
jgi:anti-sigma B factor antagonist